MGTFTKRCHSKRVRLGFARIIGTLSLLFLLSFFTQSSFAQTPCNPSTGIQIDGNPCDWGTLFNSSTPQFKRFVKDMVTNDNAFTNGSSDEKDVSTWGWNSNGANDKTNIVNAGVFFDKNTGVAYFFADRSANNGDAAVGFWILQDPVAMTGTLTGTFTNTHKVGDILVISHFENGGTAADIKAYRWSGTGLVDITNSSFFPVILDGAVNGSTVDVPSLTGWSYTSKNEGSVPGKYPQNTFFEGSIDLNNPNVGLDLDACTARFLIETRNSQSTDAALGDFVLGSFGTPPVSQSLNATNYCSNDANKGTITMNGSETGVSYQLKKVSDGSNVQTAKDGTGTALTWTGVAGGSYYIEAINGVGCITTFGNPTVVTEVPAPTADAGGPYTICSSDASVQVTGTYGGGATGGTWSGGAGTWGTASTNTSAKTVTNTYTPTSQEKQAGSVLLTFTTLGHQAPCNAASQNVAVTIKPAAIVHAGQSNPICQSANPSAITLSGASVGGGAATGAWSIISGGGTLSSTAQTDHPESVTYTPAANFSGTVTLRLTTNNPDGPCNEVSEDRTIAINQIPVGSASPQTICNGDKTNVALNSTVNGTTFTWTAAQQSGATVTGFSNCTSNCGTSIQQTLTNSGVTAGVVRYTVTPKVGDCPGNTFTVDVTVNPTPTVNAVSNRTHCNGDNGLTIPFTGAVSGTTFTWHSSANVGFGTDGTGDIAAYTASNTGTTPVTATVTVTPSANTCTGQAITFTVKVNPTPVGSASAATICNGSTTNVALNSNVTGTSFTWTAALQSGTVTGFSNCTASCGTAIKQTLSNSGTTNGVVRYTVTPSANGCTGSAFTVDVTVRPTLDANISGTATICQGSGTNVTFSGVAGTIISYNVGGGATQTATLDGNGQLVLPTGNLSATTTYNLTGVKYATEPACPQTLNKSVTVTVRPTLDANVSGTATICAGTGTNITFSGTAGTVVSYKVGVSGIVQTQTLNNSGQFILATGNLNSTTTYYLTGVRYATEPNCPQTLNKSVTVTVNAVPVLVITNPDAVCMPHTVDLTAAAVTAGSTMPEGTTLSYFESDGTTPLAHPEAVTVSGTYVIKATGPAPTNCSDSKEVTATINDCAITYCTYTQGYYGNAKGSSCSPEGKQSTAGLMAYALGKMSGQKLYIGSSGKSFTVRLHASPGADDGDIQGVIKVLPGGGKSSQLSSDVYANNVPTAMLKNGRLTNQLLSQTITMGLNMYVTSELQSLVLRSDMPLVSYGKAVSGCDVSNTQINPCDVRSMNLNAKVIKYLQNNSGDGKARVSALFNLASAVLGGMLLPEVGDGDTYKLTMEDISSVEDAINNVFDGCRIFNGYDELAVCPTLITTTTTTTTRMASKELTERAVDKLSVMAYPNPFTDMVKFTIASPVSGQAQLEVVNMLGQKVATVYNGLIQAGKSQVVEYKVPTAAQQNLIYVLKIGGQRVTGKLLKAKK